MREIQENIINEIYDNDLTGCLIDYVVLCDDDNEYIGIESHKSAVIKAFEILTERRIERCGYFLDYDFQYKVEEEKMAAKKIDVDKFFVLPNDPNPQVVRKDNAKRDRVRELAGWRIKVNDPDTDITNGETIIEGNDSKIVFEQKPSQVSNYNGQMIDDAYKVGSTVTFSKDCNVTITPVYAYFAENVNEVPIYVTEGVVNELGFQMTETDFETEEQRQEFENVLFSKMDPSEVVKYDLGTSNNYVYNTFVKYCGLLGTIFLNNKYTLLKRLIL